MQTTDAARAPRSPGELEQDRSWLALRRCRRSGGRAGVRPRRGGLLHERGRRGRRRRGRAARGRGRLGSGRRRRRRRIELAARDPGQQRQHLAPVEALLLVLHVVVFEVRLVRRLRRITQDLRDAAQAAYETDLKYNYMQDQQKSLNRREVLPLLPGVSRGKLDAPPPPPPPAPETPAPPSGSATPSPSAPAPLVQEPAAARPDTGAPAAPPTAPQGKP